MIQNHICVGPKNIAFILTSKIQIHLSFTLSPLYLYNVLAFIFQSLCFFPGMDRVEDSFIFLILP